MNILIQISDQVGFAIGIFLIQLSIGLALRWWAEFSLNVDVNWVKDQHTFVNGHLPQSGHKILQWMFNIEGIISNFTLVWLVISVFAWIIHFFLNLFGMM